MQGQLLTSRHVSLLWHRSTNSSPLEEPCRPLLRRHSSSIMLSPPLELCLPHLLWHSSTSSCSALPPLETSSLLLILPDCYYVATPLKSAGACQPHLRPHFIDARATMATCARMCRRKYHHGRTDHPTAVDFFPIDMKTLGSLRLAQLCVPFYIFKHFDPAVRFGTSFPVSDVFPLHQ